MQEITSKEATKIAFSEKTPPQRVIFPSQDKSKFVAIDSEANKELVLIESFKEKKNAEKFLNREYSLKPSKLEHGLYTRALKDEIGFERNLKKPKVDKINTLISIGVALKDINRFNHYPITGDRLNAYCEVLKTELDARNKYYPVWVKRGKIKKEVAEAKISVWSEMLGFFINRRNIALNIGM